MCHLKWDIHIRKMSCCFGKGRGTPLKHSWLSRPPVMLGCFLEHKDIEESRAPNQRKFLWSTRHFSLFPLRKRKPHHCRISCSLFLPWEKKRGGCYLTKSPMTLVQWLLWNTNLFNDANYKQRENIRRICLEISLFDWKLASLIELAGFRFSLQKHGRELWSVSTIWLLRRTSGNVETERRKLGSIWTLVITKSLPGFSVKTLCL